MIYKNKQDITAMYYGTKPIIAVYHGGRLVWQAVKSCFGSGYWINDKQWSNIEAWKNEV